MRIILSKMFVLLQAANDTVIGGAVQDVSGEMKTSFWQMFNYGGWIMYLLLAMSIIAIYIFVERLLVINKAGQFDKDFMSKIRSYIYNGDIKAARILCQTTDSPLSHVIDSGLSRLGNGTKSDIDKAIETTANVELASLDKNVALVGVIGGAAPMLGFLGTVIGMVNAFYNMSVAGNNLDIALLATGIYQAMVTTIGGLIVGITAYVLHNILNSRINKVGFLLQAKSMDFLDLLNEPTDK